MNQTHELIIPNEDLPFKMFLFEGEHGNYFRDKHWHRSIEIFAVFEGSLTFYLNDKEWNLNAGNFMIVNSNEIHAVDSPDPNKTIVVQIPLQTFKDYFTGDQYIRFTHESTEQDVELMNLIRVMFTDYECKNMAYEWSVKSNFYRVLYLLVSKYRENSVDEELLKQNKQLNKLTPITNYIKEHYREEVSLESLAEQFGYAPAYISRMFQKYVDINYKDYLQGVRVESAYAELTGTNHTVSDIALNHGFPSSRAFSKAFQKKYGMLPSEFIRSR